MVPFEKNNMSRKRSNSNAEIYRTTQPQISISEDDIRFNSAKSTLRMRRCTSVPYGIEDLKSIMKFRTLDESLHSEFGSEKGSQNGSSQGPEPGVKMGKVEVREYSRTIGDNPSCSSGAPLSISWEYNIMGAVDVDKYEEIRPVRRKQLEMVLPRDLRDEMLRKEWDVTQREIVEAIRENVKVKSQRRTTVNNLGKAAKVEEIMESLGRKVKRTLKFERTIGSQARRLEAQHNEALRLRQQQFLELDMKEEYEIPSSADDLSS